MIKLVAALYESGICCVIIGGSYRLIQPPYNKDAVRSLTKYDVSNAIVQQGFCAEDKDFASFEELVKFLQEKLLKGEWEKPKAGN